MKSEICVVGGGPAGLAAAIALAQAGREVTVLEAAMPPIDKACGEGLLPDGSEALAQLGVRLEHLGATLQGIRFLNEDTVISGRFPNGRGRTVRRVTLHECLVKRAEQLGVRLLWGVKKVQTTRGQVRFQEGQLRTQLIVGADGQNSLVRRQAGLDEVHYERKRYGFRRHYGMKPWSDYVEVYWAKRFQVYVTPVTENQVGLALLSEDPHGRLNDALRQLPALAAKLGRAPAVTKESGSLTISRKLRRVTSDGYVLAGDASGSVDAITGEGLCLAFQQAAAIAKAVESDDWPGYERTHAKIMARARQMSTLLLLLSRYGYLRSRALAAMVAHPKLFESLLAAHVGQKRMTEVLSWQLVSFGLEVLCA